MEELNKEIQLAMTGDLHRAADFLKGAREIRAGSKKQRRISREAQRNAWKKDADLPARWQSSTITLTAMALRHGNKTYLQILLDPYRAKLVMDQAKSQGIRATAWIRNAVYKELERELSTSIYKDAEAKDEAVWRESVLRRVQGRTANETNNETPDPEVP